MNVNVGDIITMKKQHPCGSSTFLVTRIGMDFKIVCRGCGQEILLPSKAVEKGIKKIESGNGEN